MELPHLNRKLREALREPMVIIVGPPASEGHGHIPKETSGDS